MRITGGKARGIPLKAPGGRATRPATDQMREAVFSSLGAGVDGARVADLFAGTGAYGLEAMSRGAAGGLFVENSGDALACLRSNLQAVSKSCGGESVAGNWSVLASKVYALGATQGPFDLIFVDPPYALIEAKIQDIFGEIIAPLVAPDGRVCLEMPGALEVDFPGWECIRRLGKSGKDKPSAGIYRRAG
ncbi:MAG: methyltransferase [Coraliomargarita sp. TMED73]|jgi:16S rRNA (guanine966-N2)-methyltransferase|nr:MAG: methyltransferase [Coraliomargarita sp. TMED73]